MSEAANLLDVCSKTLRRWDRAHLFLPAFHTPGEYRRYMLTQIQIFRGDLQRQVDELIGYCTKHRFLLLKSIQDVGSGLNNSQKGLHQVIRMVNRGKYDIVVIAYSDCLPEAVREGALHMKKMWPSRM
ncbi:MAG: MerR family transcriptional regulator [Promethearchaeota archaeon]